MPKININQSNNSLLISHQITLQSYSTKKIQSLQALEIMEVSLAFGIQIHLQFLIRLEQKDSFFET